MNADSRKLHERDLAREYRRRLHIRDAHNPKLPRIFKMLGQGMTHAEIGQAIGLDRSRISAIVRAAKAADAEKTA